MSDLVQLFLPAIGQTLALTFLGFAGTMVVGTLIAICLVGPIKPLNILGQIYVEIFRNMPMLCLLVLIVFGLPDIGVKFSLFNSALLTMILLGGAFAATAITSGINSVSVGNAEAARAIGLSFSQSLRYVILPQAFASMIPPLVNVLIGQLLGSSLAAAIGVGELTYAAQAYNLAHAGGLGFFAVAASFYIVVALGFGAGGSWLEKKVQVSR